MAMAMGSVPPGFPVPGPGPVNPSLVPASGPLRSSAASSSSVAPAAKAKAKAKAKATARPKPQPQIKIGWLSVKFTEDMQLHLEVLAPSHPHFRAAIGLLARQEPPQFSDVKDITDKKLANFRWLKQNMKDLGWLVGGTKSSDSWMFQIKFNKVGTKSYKKTMALRRLHVVATGTWPSFSD